MPLDLDGFVTGALSGQPTLDGDLASVRNVTGAFTTPEGGVTEIFWATFHNTYAELEAQYQAGKTILLRVWDIPYIHYLTLHNDSKFVFAAVFQGPLESASIAVSYAVCNSTDGWLPTEVRMTSFDYEDLWDLPSINGVTLTGDKSASDLGLAEKLFESGSGQYSTQRIMPSGSENNASGHLSLALGANSIASGTASIAHGIKLKNAPPATASGDQSVAMGGAVVASGLRAQAFGQVTVASGDYSTAIGNQTTAAGNSSQAFGQGTATTAPMSSAFGNYTIASGRACFVAGQYNVEDTNPVDTTHGNNARKYIAIIGNGTAENARSNALTVDWDGNEVLAGKLTLGASPASHMDAATKSYVDTEIASIDAEDVGLTPISAVAIEAILQS